MGEFHFSNLVNRSSWVDFSIDISDSDTSVHLADTKVEANLFKNQIAGNYGGVVGASYATGAGIDIGYDKRQRNIGTDITTPIGMFGGHVGCITEVCIGACVNVRVCWSILSR